MSGGGCRVVVGGVDPQEHFGLFLTDESVLGPPPPKLYQVDVPGGNGAIDLTEALSGDVAYGNRECEFVLRMKVGGSERFERVKMEVSNLLHGRRLPYEFTADPGYVYTGRFTVDEYYSKMHSGCIKLKVTADPYKSKGLRTYRVNAAGGVAVSLESGRCPVRPTVEVARRALVSMGDRTWEVGPGSWELDGLMLREGANRLVVNTYPEYSHAVWAGYAGKAWSALSGWLVSRVAAGGAPLVDPDEWALHAGRAWGDLAGRTWLDLCRPAQPGDEFAAYIQYEWKDL